MMYQPWQCACPPERVDSAALGHTLSLGAQRDGEFFESVQIESVQAVNLFTSSHWVAAPYRVLRAVEGSTCSMIRINLGKWPVEYGSTTSCSPLPRCRLVWSAQLLVMWKGMNLRTSFHPEFTESHMAQVYPRRQFRITSTRYLICGAPAVTAL